MSYYQGDYYRGDYYRGDPGFLGRIKEGVKGAVGGFLRGGPIGAIKGGVTGVLTGRAPARPPMIAPLAIGGGARGGLPVQFAGGPQGVNVPATMGVPEPGFKGAVQRTLPFGETGYGAAPPGYHINKAYLRFLRAEAMGKAVQNPFNQMRATNLVVKNRRINPLNPRALRSSVRRQRGAVTLMRRAMAGTGYTISRKGLGGKRKRAR